MDFLERFFDISPDGGSGTTEILCVAVVLAVIAMVLFRNRLISARLRLSAGGWPLDSITRR